jgi:transcriptional regulator with XRE-family HTH domain
MGNVASMGFPERLAAFRKEKGLSQRRLAERINLHVAQIRRYESGSAQPTLDVIRRLAIALSVSADALVFDENERGPSDDLRLQFEAVSRLDAKDREVVRSVIEGILLKHEARRVLGTR